MFGFGMQELLVILAIVLLIFGPKRLKNIGADLGNAIKGFRTAAYCCWNAWQIARPY